MTEDQALRLLANGIWDQGQILEGAGCLLPKGLFEKDPIFEEASEVLYEKYSATHFSRSWKENGKSVTVTLFASGNFGATLKMGLKVLETEVLV